MASLYRGEAPADSEGTASAPPLHVLKECRRELRRNSVTPDEQELKRGSVSADTSLAKPLLAGGVERARTLSDHGLTSSQNLEGLKNIFWDPMCILLVCSPLGILSACRGWGASCTFWLNFAALIPLAKLLGDGTEEVAAVLQNDTVSGLLNASFGNAVEMIVSIQALRNGLFSIVKTSLLGSILSNVLLVLGTSFLCGGLSHRTDNKHTSFAAPRKTGDLVVREKEQTFGVKSALVSMGMLLFSCMSFALPTIFDEEPGDDHVSVLKVSRLGALIVMSTYIAFLLFQLVTHKAMVQQDESMDADGEEEEEAKLSLWLAIAIMGLSTLVVAINSEFLVDALEDVVKSTGIPESFIGVILLPLAGNACEHAGAIRFAILDRPGLSIGIAVGSSTQIALLVIPFSVVSGWLMDRDMDLNFGILNTAVMLLSVLVVLALVMDGRANWLKGYIMVAMYVFIAILYWFVPPPASDMTYNPDELPQ
mmetsp:Transcript_66825/g.124853  ORF Transcript_66825/g.124853 Transcript_66825/m.124853 type:complete len:480 (+) Transcript_66825:71-1510(+)